MDSVIKELKDLETLCRERSDYLGYVADHLAGIIRKLKEKPIVEYRPSVEVPEEVLKTLRDESVIIVNVRQACGCEPGKCTCGLLIVDDNDGSPRYVQP